MKKIPTRITPHTGGQEKILRRKKKEESREKAKKA